MKIGDFSLNEDLESDLVSERKMIIFLATVSIFKIGSPTFQLCSKSDEVVKSIEFSDSSNENMVNYFLILGNVAFHKDRLN